MFLNPYRFPHTGPEPIHPILSLPGLQGWFDASDASTITTNAQGTMLQWNDKSTAARHMTPDAVRSAFKAGAGFANGTVVANGNGGCRMNFPACTLPNESYYAFAVSNAGTNNMLLSNQTIGRYMLWISGDELHSNTGSDTLVKVPLVSSSQLYISGRTASSVSALSKMYFANTSVEKPPIGCIVNGVGVYPGAIYLNGVVGEIIFGDQSLTQEQIDGILAYLKTKWKIP